MPTIQHALEQVKPLSRQTEHIQPGSSTLDEHEKQLRIMRLRRKYGKKLRRVRKQEKRAEELALTAGCGSTAEPGSIKEAELNIFAFFMD